MIVVVVDGNSSDSNHSYKHGIVVQPNLMPASLYTPSSSPPTLPRPQASQARVDASHVLYAKRYIYRTISHSLHLCHHLCSIHSLCNRQCQPLLQFLSTLGAVGGLRIQRRMRGRCGAVLAALELTGGEDAGKHACEDGKGGWAACKTYRSIFDSEML